MVNLDNMLKRKESAANDSRDLIVRSNDDVDNSPKRKGTIDTMNDNTKQFQCVDCGKVFQHKQNLVKHSKTHDTWIFVYQCSCCNYAFKSTEAMKKHLKKLGKDVKSVVCTRSYVNAISMEPVGESTVIDLSSRSGRTKKKETKREYEKMVEKSTAIKLKFPVYTKRQSEMNKTT